jgi:hypothetical protein
MRNKRRVSRELRHGYDRPHRGCLRHSPLDGRSAAIARAFWFYSVYEWHFRITHGESKHLCMVVMSGSRWFVSLCGRFVHMGGRVAQTALCVVSLADVGCG